jgi:hypothetical protein
MNERSVKVKMRILNYQILLNIFFYRPHFLIKQECKQPKKQIFENLDLLLRKEFLSLSVVHKPILQWQVSSFYWE